LRKIEESSLRDSTDFLTAVPGVKTPGYYRASLRDGLNPDFATDD
jgi:hypothetical protein